jgi:hypothetical protein
MIVPSDLNQNDPAARLIRAIRSRFETKVIGRLPGALPYLERTVLWESGLGSLTLHRFRRNDADVPHDHSFDFLTFILRGAYREERFQATSQGLTGRIDEKWMRAGRIGFRKAETIHRVHVDGGEAWSLVLRGPKFREWSFWPESGPVLWWLFLNCDQPAPHRARWFARMRTILTTPW